MIRLLEFRRSPNCAKVRIALRYKGLPFETREMSASDRGPMLEAAGWPLVPVLLDDGVTLRESEAILHYLESNYRDAPSLTPASVEGIREGEALVLEARWRLRPALRRIYGQAVREPAQRDPAALASVPTELAAALEPLNRRLEERPYLVGETMSLYDVLLAASLTPLRPDPTYAAQSPMWAFFAENLSVPAELTNLAPWIDRVVAWDR